MSPESTLRTELNDTACELRHAETEALIDTKLNACKETLMDDIHEIRQFVDHINSAFVKDAEGDRDYMGHHGDHAARIAASKAEKEFWEVAKREAIKGGVAWIFHVLKIVLILALVGLSMKVGGIVKFP